MSGTLTARRPADSWAPLYLLSSVGAGGLVVTFFMWLYMWVPHPGQPVPVFEDIASAFARGAPLQQAMIVVAVLGIVGFSWMNLRQLFWNIGRYQQFRQSAAYAKLLGTNGESQLTALPLAIAMSINVGFILGLVFVPGLWSVVEYLFPLAMIAFAATMLLALAQVGGFLGRTLAKGGFNFAANTSFAQVLPAFAFAMIGVGFSAPAALSGNATVAGIALIASTLLLVMAVLWAAVAVVLGVSAMLQHGVNAESAPTLLILVPLMTVLGILVLRQNHGLDVHFGSQGSVGDTLILLTQFMAVQVGFGLFGLAILRSQGYARRYLRGNVASVGSYALICPGVALSVMMQFWINNGLVDAGLVAKFGAGYWALSAVSVGFQLGMVALILLLNRRHFRPIKAVAAPAA